MNTTYFNRNLGELTKEELTSVCPSIFAENPHAKTSKRYSFLPTASILDGMREIGFAPVAAQEQNVRDESREGYQKHMIRFAHLDDIKDFGYGMERAEIIIVNSHDRSSSYQLTAGIFRQICSNGMVVSDSTFGTIRVAHMNFTPGRIIEESLKISSEIPRIMDGVNQMRSIILSEGERQIIAEATLIARYGSIEKAPIRPEMLLQAKRANDSGNDLWKTLNVVQENAIKGGQRDYTKRRTDGALMGKTRAVKGIDGNVNLNKALWHLAEEMKKMKSI